MEGEVDTRPGRVACLILAKGADRSNEGGGGEFGTKNLHCQVVELRGNEMETTILTLSEGHYECATTGKLDFT